jgi:hypothetical protein
MVIWPLFFEEDGTKLKITFEINPTILTTTTKVEENSSQIVLPNPYPQDIFTLDGD